MAIRDRVRAFRASMRPMVADATFAVFISVFVSVIIESLSLAGLVTVNGAYFLLVVAWIIGFSSTFFLDHIWSITGRHRIAFGSILGVILLILAFVEYQSHTVEPQALAKYAPAPASACVESVTRLLPDLRKLVEKFEVGVVPSALGGPDGCVKVISHASKGVYQSSVVIWVAEPNQGFYVIPLNTTNTWSYFNETYWQMESMSERINLSRSHRPLPKGMHYPFAGIATYLKNNPDQWDRFRYLKWHCQLDGGSILYRKYLKGFALGPFPVADWASTPSQIYYFYDNKTVEVSQLPEVSSGACLPIPDL